MWRQWSCSFSRWRNQWLNWRATALQSGPLCVLLLFATLISLSGCAPVSDASRTQRSTAQATPTPPPVATPPLPTARPLVWTSAKLPAAPQSTLGVAQSDGAIAYACAPASASPTAKVAIWITHDRGASWQQMVGFTPDVGSLNAGNQIQVVSCQMVVDTAQAAIAVAQVGFLPTGGCFPVVNCIDYALYLSTDAGQHWARLQAPQVVGSQGATATDRISLDVLLSFATTRQDVTYALFGSTPRSASSQAVTLEVSHDHMRAWSPVSSLAGLSVTGFWLNPVTGALLVRTGYDQIGFETSADGGALWSALGAPPFSFAYAAVQQPFTDQPWRICGENPVSGGVQQNAHVDDLACTADNGAHWETHHLDVPNDLGGMPGGGANYHLVGIADDGSALFTARGELKRVVSGVAQTQALGPAPDAGLLVYTAGDGDGVLWSAPQDGYTNPDPHGRIFTANYA